MKIYIKKAEGIRGIREAVSEAFSLNAAHLPMSMDARIVLKPNLNANMNALTGNTTDLRLLASVIEFLKERGSRKFPARPAKNVNGAGFGKRALGATRNIRRFAAAAPLW